jgi:hypothetical protein
MLSSTLAAVAAPADRYEISRWVRKTQSGTPLGLSPYLKSMAGYPDKVGTDVIVAMDLADVVSAAEIREYLADSTVLGKRDGDLEAIAQTLVSIQGVTLGIRITDRPVAKLRIDFARDASVLEGISKALILQVLSDSGGMIDDLEQWTPEVRGNTVYLGGVLSLSGLRRVLSLVDPPLPPLQEPDPVPSSASTTPEPVNPKALPSQRHFREVQKLVTDVKRPDSTTIKTTGQYALWLDRYARKIDQLPILNVDSDLLDYGAKVASTFRQLATGFRKVGTYAATKSQNPSVRLHSPYYGITSTYAHRGRWGVSRGAHAGIYWQFSPGPSAATIAKRVGRAGAAQQEAGTMAQLDDETARIRRLMTERYQIEF